MSASADPPDRSHFDAVVIGAGPAGAIAARELASAGLQVAMADPLMPAVPKLGETLPGAAVRLLTRLGLGAVTSADNQSVGSPVGGTLVAWNSSSFVATDALSDPYGKGLRLDRTSFDATLRNAAMAAGARFHQTRALSLERNGPSWNLGLGDGNRWNTRWVVDATGRRAHVARQMGFVRERGPPLVALYTTARPSLSAEMDRTVIEASPDGWFYAGRMSDGEWAIGFHTNAQFARQIGGSPKLHEKLLNDSLCLSRLLGRIAVSGEVVVRDARGLHLPKASGDGWIACGDAACSFDPIAGQGLFNALRTGMAAAECVKTGFTAAGRRSYDDELKTAMSHYIDRRRALYRAERRWMMHPFWSVQRAL